MTFLPSDGAMAGSESNQRDIRHAVTYIANEFLENAMKYHERLVDIPIAIRLELTSDQITVRASNAVGVEQAKRYKLFVDNILAEDAGELIIRQLEESSLGKESNISGLGLLTMISDYRAQLNWQFEPHLEYPEMMTVTTSAVLPLTNLNGVSA